MVKNPPGNAGDAGLIPGSGRPLKKEMATHSSILAWRIPWTKESGYSPWGHRELDMTETTRHSSTRKPGSHMRGSTKPTHN